MGNRRGVRGLQMGAAIVAIAIGVPSGSTPGFRIFVSQHTAVAGPAQSQPETAIVPRPRRVVPGTGRFVADRETRVQLGPELAGMRPAIEGWLEELRTTVGLPLPLSVETPQAGAANVIAFAVSAAGEGGDDGEIGDDARDAEAYRIRVGPRAVNAEAGSAAGLFYALQTLRQLMPAARATESTATLEIATVLIEDRPRFAYRGMHLDVGRHLFPLEFIKRYLDLMARYKLNRFHWHLTEDQGWRIEIERYPRLTEIGAWRAGTAIGKRFDPYGRDPTLFHGDGVRYGGYYTREQVRAIVAYAAERHITVIPEIEMPGHSSAALAAYPELGCTPGPFDVGMRWGIYDDIYCPSETTFEFLEGVLTEVMELFPGEYIHVGGDEAPKLRWEASALAQEVIRREGLADEAELQSWFIQRIERFLNANGRRLIGWDEILEGGLAPDATVMSWRGNEGGIEAARAGHDVVMAPYSHVYFDYYQSDDVDQEPLAIGGHLPLETVYEFEPVPDELDEAEARHVLGAQANLWTEYISTPEHAEYMLLPRMLALAEVVWSPAAARDWSDFRARLPNQLDRLDALGVNYRVPDVEGLVPETRTRATTVTVELAHPVPGAVVRYTLDGNHPGPDAPRYDGPLTVAVPDAGVVVSARAFLPNGRTSHVARGVFRRPEG